ncbi:MAG: bifunctional diguanylate cyclase/phosphodiesterase [Alphaproteobacteria bacterium]|nr:bifunctional diguanylate cyclase/phosphodiesterase [Alphaproteobacteria bacterium]
MGKIRDLYSLRKTDAAQIEALLGNLPQIVFGHVAVTLFTVLICMNGAARNYVLVWGAAMLLSVVPTVLGVRLLGGEARSGVSPGSIASRLVVMASMRALFWLVGLATLLPMVDPGTAYLLEFVMFGMIVGGVFSYWTLPPAALIFSGAVAVGSLIGVWTSAVPNQMAMTAVILVSALFFNRVALIHARNIRIQSETARHLEAERAVVGLLLRDFEDGSKDWLWEINDEGFLTRGAGGFATALNVPEERLTARPFVSALETLAVSGEQIASVRRLGQTLAEGQSFTDQEVNLGEFAESVFVSFTAKAQPCLISATTKWHGVASDISAERRAQAHVRRLALFDPLTNLPNRAQLRSALGGMRGSASAPLWVAYGDLDGFKHVNDSQGHAAGDAVLCELSQRFRQHIAPEEMVARIGGDEFVFVLRGSAASIEQKWQGLIALAEQPVILSNHTQQVGLSLGIVQALEGETVDEILRRADLALYNAKQQGRGIARYHTMEMEEAVQARREMELALRRALAAGEFTMHYQPIYACGTGRLVSHEALMRWNHPAQGQISPDTFIPLAEDNGLIADIGAWALQRACEDARHFPAGTRVCVNISAHQMRSRQLLADVTKALAVSGLRPANLELEMTESALIENTGMAEMLIHDLKALGVSLALDDFGTGYSSMAYLHKFRFDRIKIDRAFVQAYLDRPESRVVVDAMIMIGRQLGISVTAEGIETEAQYRAMVEQGCDLAQGFLLGRPAPLQIRPNPLANAR